MTMDALATNLSATASALSTLDRRLPVLAGSPGALGADTGGLPGRVGRELHAHWRAVLGARAREAADTATRLAELSDTVRRVAADYDATDASVATTLHAATEGWS